MNAPTLLAAQIIKPPPDFIEVYAVPLACLGVAAVGVVMGMVCLFVGVGDPVPPGILCVALIGGGFLFGAGSLVDTVGKDGPRVDESATADLIEKAYSLTGVQASASDDLTVEGLCQPVSLNSPEFVGIADGQKVTFRVGVPDCKSPDPQIVITETTARTIDVDELRR